MAKDNSTNRKKALQRLRAAKGVPSHSQRVLADVKKLNGSLKKLIYSSAQSVVDRCRGAWVAVSQRVVLQCRKCCGVVRQSCKKIADLYLLSRQWLVKKYRRVVILCRQGLDAGRNRIASGYQRSCLRIKHTYQNLVAQCAHSLESARLSIRIRVEKFATLCHRKIAQLVKTGRKIARQYKTARIRTRQAYKKLIRLCTSAIQGTVAIGQNLCLFAKQSAQNCHLKVVRQYRRACVLAKKLLRACRQGFKASKRAGLRVAGYCGESLEQAKLKLVKTHLKIVKVARNTYQTFIRLCLEGFNAAKGAYEKVCFLAKQSCKNGAALCRQKLEAGRLKTQKNVSKQYRKIRIAARKSIRLCLDGVRTVKRTGLKVANGSQKACLIAKNRAALCRQKLEAGRLEVSQKAARQYQQVRVGTNQTCQKLLRLCRDGFDAAKRAVFSTGLKVANGSKKLCFLAKQSAKNLATFCYLKVVVGYRRVQIATRKFIRLCRGGFNAVKGGLFTVGQKLANGSQKVSLLAKQSVQNFAIFCHLKVARAYRRVLIGARKVVRLCRTSLKAAKRGVVAFGLNVKNSSQKACFLAQQSAKNVARQYRKVVRLCLQGFKAAIRAVFSTVADGSRKVCFATKQSAKNFATFCHVNVVKGSQKVQSAARKVGQLCLQGFNAAKRAVLKGAAGFQKAWFLAKKSVKNFAVLCHQRLEASRLKARQKVARHYRKVRIGTRQAYRKLRGLYLEGCDFTKQAIVAICRKVANGYQKGCFAIKQSCRKFANRCRLCLEKSRLKAGRQYRKVRIGTRQAYRKLRGLYLEGCASAKQGIVAIGNKFATGYRIYQELVSDCREGLEQSRLKAGRQYRKVITRTKRTCKNLARESRQILKGLSLTISDQTQKVKQNAMTFSTKLFRRVRVGTKRAYKNLVKEFRQGLFASATFCRQVAIGTTQACKKAVRKCYQSLIAFLLKIVQQFQKMGSAAAQSYKNLVKNWDRTLDASRRKLLAFGLKMARGHRRTKQAYKNLISGCRYRLDVARQKLQAFGLKIARGYRRALIGTGRACRDFLRLCLSAFGAAKQQIHLASLKIARKNLRAVVIARRTYRDFLRLCWSAFGAAKQQVHLAGLKIARTNLRAVVIARRTYRDFLKLCLSVFGAAKQQIHLAGLKIARTNLRAVVIARRSYRNFFKLCGQALKAAQQGVLILWKRSIYKSLRAVVKVRRSYRNLAHPYRIAIKEWKEALAKQVQKVPAALEEIDQSVKKTEEQDQWAFAQFKSRVSFSIDKAVDLCSRRFGKWIVRRKAPAGASTMYQHRYVENEMSEEMGFSGRKKSFFSKFTERLPTRGRFKNLRVYSFKQWVSFLLIGFVSIYFLVITYLIANRYKDFDFPNIALGESTPRTAKGKRVNSPPLALIAYSVDEKKNRKAAASKNPSGYSFWPKRVTLRHVEGWGEGVSFGTDYSTLAMLFAPDYRVGKIMPMLDLRGHRFDNNAYAANIGIAGRYIPNGNGFCQILGLNVFYDWREGKLGDFQQIGVGLEILGKRWDLRANGYAPISIKKRKIKCIFNQYEGGYYAINRRCEFTSYGFNAEVGYYIVRSRDFLLYAAGGPYYLVRKDHSKTRGGEFRVRPQYKDYLALDFSVSHDNAFGTVYQAQVILYLPLYQLSKRINKRPCGLSDQQIYQPIERFEVMPLGRRCCWQTNF